MGGGGGRGWGKKSAWGSLKTEFHGFYVFWWAPG